MMIATVEDQNRFPELMDEWRDLLADSDQDCLFLTGEWLETWWRCFARDRWTLSLITVRRRRRLVGIAPFFARPARFGEVLPWRSTEFLGTGMVGSDYLDLILKRGEEESVARALAEHLGRSQPTLTLSHLPAISSGAEALIRELEQEGWLIERELVETCPYISLRGHTWESYLGSLGAEHRYNFQRRLRNLHKQGAVLFEAVEKEDQRREALQTLRSLHNRCWDLRGGSQAMQTEREYAFHEAFSRAALERGWLRLFLLRLNSRPIGALYGFRRGPRFYFYQSGFDPAWRKHSAGLVTMGLSIKQALAEGAEEFDFLHGTESYKFLWTKETRRLARVHLFPSSWKGLLHQQARELETWGKRWVRHAFPSSLLDRLVARRRTAA